MSGNAPRAGSAARPAGAIFLIALLAAPVLLRAPISSVPPALSEIAAALRLGPAVASLATAMPVACFGLFAFITPLVYRLVGLERTLAVALGLICVGIVARSVSSTAAFFTGTLVVGLGIAIGNVVLPAIVRSRFPLRVPQLMAIYSLGLQLGATLGAFLTTPLIAAGFSWSLALGVWVLPALAMLVTWLVAAQRSGSTGAAAGKQAGLASVLRLSTTWAVLAYMGLQSLLFYGMLTWIPRILAEHGLPTAQIGFWFGLFNLLGLPGSFLGPALVGRRFSALAIWAITGTYLVGVVALMTSSATAVLGVVLCGLVQGCQLSLGLTLIARQRHPDQVAPVSAIAQGGGYLLASLGPWLMGLLYAATGAWSAAMALLIVITLTCGLSGVWAATHRRDAEHA